MAGEGRMWGGTHGASSPLTSGVHQCLVLMATWGRRLAAKCWPSQGLHFPVPLGLGVARALSPGKGN